MGVLDRIKAQGARGETHTLEVPEWGDENGPLVVHYHRPTLSNAAAAVEAAPGNSVRQNLEMFCQLARNADGSPMFRRIDVLELMDTADPLVLGRVMREMGIIAGATEAEIEKN